MYFGPVPVLLLWIPLKLAFGIKAVEDKAHIPSRIQESGVRSQKPDHIRTPLTQAMQDHLLCLLLE